jgi:hypothetical protein
VTNSFGTALSTLSSYDATVNSPESGAASRAHRASSTSGSCSGFTKFFAPDRNGDANSTEVEDFYGLGCITIARDSVRIYTSTGANSETVTRTVTLYANLSRSKIGTRTDTATISNATFDSYGFPIAANGFDSSETSRPESGDYFKIASGQELVVLPGTDTIQYCGNSAGISPGDFLFIPEAIGWEGVDENGSRTVNRDGSVTWGSTHAGTVVQQAWNGPSLSMTTGKQNVGCPIVTPMFALEHASVISTYDIPVSVRFQNGIPVDFSIPGATFSYGYTLTVSSTPGASPTSSSFIQGTVTNGTKQIATFSLNCFGDGMLTLPQTGQQSAIVDWRIVARQPVTLFTGETSR